MRGIRSRIRRWRNRRDDRLVAELRDAADREIAASRDPEARELLGRVLALRPKGFGALLRAARVHQRLGETEAARALWKRACERRDDSAETFAECARHALAAGDLAEARACAERACALDRAGVPFGWGDAMGRLLVHLDEPARIHRPSRHLTIGGVSYCGSTLLGYVLGGLPGVANVGESHWLVNRRDGANTRAIDFAADPVELHSACNHCGVPCQLFDAGFRQGLADDPSHWFERIAERLECDVLISSDKNVPKLRALDPGLRFDLLILFKTPADSWRSTRRKAHVSTPLERHLSDWHDTYASLLHDLPATGRMACLHFDAFRHDPELVLERLCKLFELPFDAAATRLDPAPQHTFGGNPRAHRTLESGTREIQREEVPDELPATESERIAAFEASSPVLAELRARHQQDFGA